MAYFEDQRRDLAELADRARARRLSARAGHDFSSNDYLALAGDPALAAAVRAAIDAGVPIGSGGSRLLRGNHEEHERLEATAAGFFGSESALYFSTGYAANAALLSTLPQRGDLIVHDALVHASAHEGIRLSRAEARGAAHNDPEAFEDVIAGWRAEGGTGQIWIAVESLYSMDGDQAPLDALAAVADRHEAILVVDEAHATGVFGDRGRGLAAGLAGRENLITLHTCGKALGCEGALLCGPHVVRDFLINRGRAFIFSTAPSPLMAVAVEAALGLIAEPARRVQLHELIARAEALLAPVGVAATGSQILPLVIGEDGRTMAMAAELQRRGFDVRGIRPPTVPAGTSRLRISLTRNVNEDDIAALAAAIGELA
ncbi:8-amino-7-oxononanoate synthase [Sphingomonas kyeonggiensis]|uniref:8-amino-7-oxononanoate synthase n=1 Tax=Sphingomonas kyeonggiensis TaxID=1268553 RepID=A0A7W6JVX8_9SPHN|nr:8-amino-7-oxononanoate synthase [Sphingomonas kyeonggiensis]MBB4100541.1 8-amino-7-oxononanoate synthase [Sphingomonas kyeonggiensis]